MKSFSYTWSYPPRTLRYRLRTVIKAQDLANFIAEFITGKANAWGTILWKVQMDGSSNKLAWRIGVVLQSPEGDIIECAVRLQFPTTNNKVEYEAILMCLDLAKTAGASLVVLHNDSQVVIRHINGEYEAKGERMKNYLDLIRRRTNQTFKVKFLQVPKGENEHADRLAKVAPAEHSMINQQILSFV